MAPPSARYSEHPDTVTSAPSSSQDGLGPATLEPNLAKMQAEKQKMKMPSPPDSKSLGGKYEEREYQKGRLALAFRIFAKLGFDEGVAGHITLRVSLLGYLRSKEHD